MIRAESLTGNPSGPQMLDISKLQDGQVADVIAYAVSCNVKMSKIGQPFATFLLKDKNSSVIPARLFNVEDGGELSQLFARKPIQLRVEAQIYNGSLSLIVDGETPVRVYNGDFDYASFVGSYSVDLTTCEAVYQQVVGGDFPKLSYEKLGVDFIGSGRIGAFAKIMDLTLSDIMFMYDYAERSEKDGILKIFFSCMHQLFIILTTYNTFGPLQRIMLADTYASVPGNDNQRYIVIDVLRCLCEGAKPLHLYSHIITSSILRAHHMLQLQDAYATMVPGAVNTIYFTDLLGGHTNGGVDLLKY